MNDAAASAPNLLLIMTDQQRFDTLKTYGFPHGHTPILDGLATDGAVFERAYCTSPLCTPSRASIFTGKHIAEHGVQRLYDSLPLDEVLFTRHLSAHGYRTGLVGKLHVSSRVDEAEHRHPGDGFDVYELCNEMTFDMDSPLHAYSAWLRAKHPDFHEALRTHGREITHYPADVHMTHWAAERTIAFMTDSHREGRPFAAVMSLFDPHNPYENAPAGMSDLVGELPAPEPSPPRDEALPRGLAREMASKTVAAHTDDLEAARRGYHASIAFLDREIGRVLRALDDLGARDDTLVMFTSDHGDMLGDRGLMTKGAFFFDPCVRVPLLARWPGRIPAGSRVSSPVGLNDIAATALAAAGIDPEVLGTDSRDLVRLARGDGEHARSFVVSSYRNGGLGVGGESIYFDPPLLATMITDDRYKLVLYHDDHTPDRGQLFDLRRDPAERDDLWDDPNHGSIRENLTIKLSAWMARQSWSMPPRGGERLPAHSVA